MASRSERPSADDLSRVRNAARGLTDGFLRFEREMERFADSVRAAGGVNDDVMAAINHGIDTTERRRAFEAIQSRIAGVENA